MTEQRGDKTEQHSLRLTPVHKRALRAHAKRMGTSMNAVIEDWIERTAATPELEEFIEARETMKRMVAPRGWDAVD